MGTPVIPLIIGLFSLLTMLGGWKWGGMARWLLMGVLGPGAFAGMLLWLILNRYAQEPTPVLPAAERISPLDPSPTDQASVRYEVQFNQDVTGVDLADFNLDPTLTDARVAEVQPNEGYSRSYTVSVNTGSGNGELQLNLIDDDSITSRDGTPLGGTGVGNGNFSGDPYTIERQGTTVAPSVSAIGRLDANPTAQPEVRYQVEFDQPVTGVDRTDFEPPVTTGAITGARIRDVQPVDTSGTTYQVFVTTGTGNGTLQLNLINDGSIKSREGIALAGDASGPLYQVQREPITDDGPIKGMW